MNGSRSTAQVRLTMQRVMQEHAAVFRTEETLAEGCKKIMGVYGQLKDLKLTDKSLIWYFSFAEKK